MLVAIITAIIVAAIATATAIVLAAVRMAAMCDEGISPATGEGE